MKAIASILFLISLSVFSFGQDEKLNQFDNKGKKDGKWIVYLNSRWKNINDSSKAVFCRYTYYSHGENIDPMGPGGGKGWTCKHKIDETVRIGKMKLLDGEYKWINTEGRTKFVHVFKNGEYVDYKEFDREGKLTSHFDHKRKWLGQPHTYFICLSLTKDTTYYFMRNGEHGWMFYGSNYDSTIVDTNKVIGDSSFVTAKFYKRGRLTGQNGFVFVKDPIGKKETQMIYHGIYTRWRYTNGQKEYEEEYHYGAKVGEEKHWDEKGNEIIKKNIP